MFKILPIERIIISGFVIFLAFFVGVFVFIPVSFYLFEDFQTALVLPSWIIPTANFSDFQAKNITGVRNFYLNRPDCNVTLGIWHILPENYSNFTQKESDFDYLLSTTQIPVLIYVHGNSRDRSSSIQMYKVLREFFHVFAFDYRGYGDSSKAPQTDQNLSEDSIFVYKWVKSKTKSPIFLWGHSLGTAISVMTLAELRGQGHQSKGLFLESAFTNSIDVTSNSRMGQFFKWLPWFKATVLDSFYSNNLGFNTSAYIDQVDCPIMMMHSEDDPIIPYHLGRRVYEIIKINRKGAKNVIFHTFPKHLGYGHGDIHKDVTLPHLIKNFIGICLQQN